MTIRHHFWGRHGEPPFADGRGKQLVPPLPPASMGNSSQESCSRNASSSAVIVRRAWTSSSSAAIWSGRKWICYFESRKRRLFVLLASCLWWQHRKNKGSKASMVSEFLYGRCFISSTSAQISRVTQDIMLRKMRLNLPSKLHSSSVHPKQWRPPKAPCTKECEVFSKGILPGNTNSYKPVCLLLKVKTFGQ